MVRQALDWRRVESALSVCESQVYPGFPFEVFVKSSRGLALDG